jgi:hypothetical protein
MGLEGRPAARPGKCHRTPQPIPARNKAPLILHFLDGGDGGWSIDCVDLRLLALLVSMPDRASYKGLGRVSVLL